MPLYLPWSRNDLRDTRHIYPSSAGSTGAGRPSRWRGTRRQRNAEPNVGKLKLPGQDSNLGQGIQSPLCYHYTTGQ